MTPDPAPGLTSGPGPTGGGVCVVGSLNVDTTYRVPALPAPGETILATGRDTFPGGKGANQAVAAAVVGSRVSFVGAVGDDENGAVGLADLARLGIDISGVQRLPHTATGTAMVVVGDDGENLIVVDPGANGRLTAAWVERAVLDRPHAVMLAQLEVPVLALRAAAAAHAGLLILNPAPVAEPATLVPLLRHVDILVPNRHELGRLASRPTPQRMEDVARCVAALEFVGTVVVTLGEHGAAIVDSEGTVREVVPAPAVAVRDTTGAGDAFCGALAHGLAQPEADLGRAVRWAVTVAAESTRYAGARLQATPRQEPVP